jgi:O-antigen biosynthesis protein WbqP
LKRIFDLLFAILLTSFLAIPFLLIIIYIKISSSGTIFYISRRIGKNKKVFKMIKLRTMKVGTPQINTNNLTNAQEHVTKFGKVLRKYSIDEIPQIFNVLVGDMSFVGPRPALESQDLLIIERDKFNIHKLKPGITGLAQINGRDMINLEKKVYFDNLYKINQSIFFDIKILIKTFTNVIFSKGVKH